MNSSVIGKVLATLLGTLLVGCDETANQSMNDASVNDASADVNSRDGVANSDDSVADSVVTMDAVVTTDTDATIDSSVTDIAHGDAGPDSALLVDAALIDARCPAGYVVASSNCVDINECNTNNGGCGANATCTNTPGGFSCARPHAYTVTWNTATSREELRQVNLTTLETTLVAVIPSVMTTELGGATRNPRTRRIYFRGQADSISRFYGLDADTGAIISQPVVPATLNFGGGIHVLENDDAFTVTWNTATTQEELRRVNLATLETTLVAAIPNVATTVICGSAHDPRTRQIYFLGHAAAGSATRLFGVNGDTGAVVSQPVTPPALNFGAGIHIMENGDAFTVTWNTDTSREELRRLNLSTMETTLVAAIPGVATTETCHWTHDSRARRIYFLGHTASEGRLYALDVDSGAVISQPMKPAALNFGAGLHLLNG